ncbi:MAG: MlaD family protein [Puniceicoccales bacterium]|jgi:paraquat-inducible protein B|nr:MlaD family protein [Puniceicoccales bacterium]
MNKKGSPFVVGVFVVSALALFGIALVILFRGNFFRNTTSVVFYFNSSLNGLDIGSAVKFKGVRIGNVKAIDIVYDADGGVTTPVVAEIDSTTFSPSVRLLPKSERYQFYQTQTMNGLAAKLSMESFVTGKLFVELDFYRPSKLRFYGKNKANFPQIPTIASEIEKFISSADHVLKQFGQIDFKNISARLVSILSNLDDQLQNAYLGELIHNISNAAMGVQNFFHSDSTRTLMEHLSAAISDVQQFLRDILVAVGRLGTDFNGVASDVCQATEKFRNTCEHLSELIEPQSDFRESAKDFLLQATKAVQSLRYFLDLLNKTPNALVAGIDYED